MPFVLANGDDSEDEGAEAAGARPAFDSDFDPRDPDVVKVHYDLSGWSLDQRTEMAEVLAEHGVPHLWDGDELIVPEAIEEQTDQLFEVLESEIGPFPIGLDAEAPATTFGLDEWPAKDLALLRGALVAERIAHSWEDTTLTVAEEHEDDVDDLLDAIESGTYSGNTDGVGGELAVDPDAEAPPGALDDLYSISTRLADDPANTKSRIQFFELYPDLSAQAPPYGVAVRSWQSVMAKVDALFDLYDAGAEVDQLAEAADELAQSCRPFV